LAELEAANVLVRRQGSGLYVSPKLHRKTIGVLLDSAFFERPEASPFWGMLWGRCAAIAQQRSETRNEAYVFHMVSSRSFPETPLPDAFDADLRAGRIHALLAFGIEGPMADALERTGLPFISFGGEGPHRVMTDPRAATCMGVAALAARGCKRIGFWEPIPPYRRVDYTRKSVHWFRMALEAVSIPFVPELVRLNRPEGVSLEHGISTEVVTTESHQEQGMRTALEVFGGGARPDGVMIADDMMTFGALVAFERLGVRVGHDVQVATQGNVGSPILFGRDDEMAVVENDPARIVEAMFDLYDRLSTGASVASRVRVGPLLRQ